MSLLLIEVNEKNDTMKAKQAYYILVTSYVCGEHPTSALPRKTILLMHYHSQAIIHLESQRLMQSKKSLMIDRITGSPG